MVNYFDPEPNALQERNLVLNATKKYFGMQI